MELTREQRINEKANEIFSIFKDMNKNYVKLIRAYHAVAVDKVTYTPEHIRSKYVETKTAVADLKRAYIDQAKAAINKIKEENGFKPVIPSIPASDQGQIRYQLERNNNILLWRAQFETATVDELRALYKENRGNPDFMVLLEGLIRSRKENTELRILKLEIDNPQDDPAFTKLNKIEKILNFYVTAETYPENLNEGIGSPRTRNISNDLSALPTDPGAVSFRPVFDIREA
jgi:hypothetical protein